MGTSDEEDDEPLLELIFLRARGRLPRMEGRDCVCVCMWAGSKLVSVYINKYMQIKKGREK